MTPARILIVEDEPRLLSHLEQILREDKYWTFTCATYGELEAFLNISGAKINLLVLDRLLQGRDSASLVEKIKHKFPDVKILILSAINTPLEKATLLNRGADDYVAKPFDSVELQSRVKALLRRANPILQVGNIELNLEDRTAHVQGIEIQLQNKEFSLLVTFLKSPGKIFDKDYLYEHVWKINADVESNVIEVAVSKLRRHLEEVGATITIKSLRNKGYWIEE